MRESEGGEISVVGLYVLVVLSAAIDILQVFDGHCAERVDDCSGVESSWVRSKLQAR